MNLPILAALATEEGPAELAADVTLRDEAQDREASGREAVTALLRSFFEESFGEVQVHVRTRLFDNHSTMIEFTFGGAHRGRFLGIPPTFRRISVSMVMVCARRGRRIERVTLYYDAGSLLRQLGFAAPVKRID